MSTFDYHRDTPEVTVEQHYRTRVLKLGESLRDRRRVYLDTRYWIFLRDAARGRAAKPEHTELLRLLRERAKAGDLICPISMSSFLELIRPSPSDPGVQRVAAEITDELSLGISIQFQEERRNTELAQFIHQKVHGPQQVHNIEDLVWTKAPYLLGLMCPHPVGMSVEDSLVVQKAFLDHLWQVPLREMYTTLASSGFPDLADRTATAERINAESETHAAELRSLRHTFLIEIRGVLDVCVPMLGEISTDMFLTASPHESKPSHDQQMRAGEQLARLIFAAFQRDKLSTELPSIRIPSALHAQFRWDKRRSLSSNDFYDFEHATAALPYCDVFCTEAGLRHLLTAKPHEFDKLYQTTVESDERRAIACIDAL